MLQCVAVRCSALQSAAARCRALQYLKHQPFRVAEGLLLYRILQLVAVCCSIRQYQAVRCSALQYLKHQSFRVTEGLLPYRSRATRPRPDVAVCRSALQRVAVRRKQRQNRDAGVQDGK